MRYNNYHKHDCYGNPWTMDVVVKPEDYCKRAVELGHDSVFTVNHGVTGNIFEWMAQCEKYNLKLRYGMEGYFVYNRFEKDRSNKHIVLVAKNSDGAFQLNDIMTESHETGFYYKPRIDMELLRTLDPNNFIVTSACVAGLWNDRGLLVTLHDMFGDNFFLEFQSHNVQFQKDVNSTLLKVYEEEKIPIIHANDSHYILPEDSKYRDILLKAKEIFYEDEDGAINDYPDSDTIYERYEKQGIVSRSLVDEMLQNTLVFDTCSDLDYINTDIKLPSVSDNPSGDLSKIVYREWDVEKKNIAQDQWPKYENAIKEELDVVDKTHMGNYFLIDYNVAKIAKDKYGGVMTMTGRGSAPSFYITKLLGLTNIDRVSAPITLFPSRFMSVERILGTRSLPDIDMNTSDREPFIKATEDLLGKENCAWMLSWKPLQDSSAFRLYCKGIGKNISEYDEIAKNLDSHREDKEWKDIIEESKRFIGVVESVSESPCSMLLYDKPVRKELGIIRTGKKGEEKYCCLLDGYNCDKYKYLKNDYLTVMVWAIIRDVCKDAGITIPTINELNKLLDEKTFDIYKDGLTCSINQADSDFATQIVKRYKPKTVSEMSAFVAIIRPGCASLLNDFVDRKDYSTGVKELDDILIEGAHRMIYQELIMKYLIWLGIPETGSYDIIKKIAKKKFKEKELEELKEKLLKGWIEKVGTEEGFIKTWTVVEEAARYSFNASHSLSYAYDSLYGAYLKSHYPLEYYSVALEYYKGDLARTNKLTNELKKFGIGIGEMRFGFSKSRYGFDKKTNQIYKGLSSLKYMSPEAADGLYEVSKNHKCKTFMEVLWWATRETQIDTRQLGILVSLDFFEKFGNQNELIKIMDLYFELFKKGNAKSINKTKVDGTVIMEAIQNNANGMTKAGKPAANYTLLNIQKAMIESENAVKNMHMPDVSLAVKMVRFKEVTGYLGYTTGEEADARKIFVMGVEPLKRKSDHKQFGYAVIGKSIGSGKETRYTVMNSIYKKAPLEENDIFYLLDYKLEKGKYFTLTKYNKISV